ncbi:MAG: hypothetical protein EPO68_00850 [Planctomycetota bacterium]|nr:MAG: hypothetical protein EPO68_00850 [Planctomycetota bacterium]
MRALAIAAIVAALVLDTPALASQVHVVATQPGPGVDFKSISAAVAAAADGDVLLVKPGTYAEHVAVHGKSIAIASDSGGPVLITGSVKIEALPASASFSMQGMHVIGSAGKAALRITDCAGSVLLEGCKVDGGFGGGGWDAPAGAAAVITRSDAVTLVGCEARGGHGGHLSHTSDPFDSGGAGGAGLSIGESKVTLHACVVLGGPGGGCDPGPCSGGSGAVGCYSSASTVHASASRFFGSPGGSGSGPFGIGSPAVPLSVHAASTLELVACLASSDYLPDTWSSIKSDASSSVSQFAIAPVELAVSAPSQVGVKPLREGEAGTLEISGATGALALLLVAPSFAYTSNPSWLGTALIGAPLTVLPLGVLGASASVSIPFTVPDQGAGIEVTLVHLQAATIDAQGALQLGAHRLAALLDASF